MNRLESGHPVEDIIFLILCDGVYRHSIATKALHEDGGLQNGESCSRYFDTMEKNQDAMFNVFMAAATSTNHKMKPLADTLNIYLDLANKIIEHRLFDGTVTDEEIIQITAEAGQALNLALDHSTKCIEMPDFLNAAP